ncbi:MAG: EscU/YscU/HrcU family type III secretion system export apparatus switch protein, partial [Phycisphaerae bacterium]
MARHREDEYGERTHEPTSLRLAEARRRGQVPRSAELTSAAAALSCVLILALIGPGLLSEMTKMTATFLDGRSAGIGASGGELRELALRGAGRSAAMVCGLLVGCTGLAALVGLAQVGP